MTEIGVKNPGLDPGLGCDFNNDKIKGKNLATEKQEISRKATTFGRNNLYILPLEDKRNVAAFLPSNGDVLLLVKKAVAFL